MSKIHWPGNICRRRRQLSKDKSLWSDERGVTAVVVGLVATLVIAAVGLGIDVVGWYRTNREMQNAADSAAIAAATNGGATYQNEAKAVAAQYGYIDASNGVHVTANNQTCPNTTTESNCVQVTVAMDTAPQFFSQVVGFPAPPLTSAAIASGARIHQYCLLALASDGTDPAITSHGANSANMTGCNIMSNTGSTCTGHNLLATNGDAHGTNNGCGINEHSNVRAVSDPYSYLASNIPATNPCSTYYTEYGQNHPPSLPSSNTTLPNPLPATWTICGDLQLSSDLTLTTATPGSVLVIRNGVLDINGHVLKTASGYALTIIFTGPDASGSYNHFPGDGTGSAATDCSISCINIQAPTSGTWSGVAIYQDPSLTKNVSFTYTGNAPTWDVTGLIYLPHAKATFKGAVNKSSYGASCFVLVVDSVLIDGTGSIEETGGCGAAGLAMPQDTVQGASLVQ
jgi:Flp pilus assembly protein TadG